MTQPYDDIDALLDQARPEPELPSAQRRRELREAMNLSRAQVARTLQVSPSTVGGWETGRDPSGEVRERYAYFLRAVEGRLAEGASEGESGGDSGGGSGGAEEPGEGVAAGVAGAPPEGVADADADAAEDDDAVDDDVEQLAVPQPCVLCGRPALHQVAGFPQHLDPEMCGTEAPSAPEPPQLARERPRGPRTEKPAHPPRKTTLHPAAEPDLIAQTVAAVLAEHEGDVEAATEALVRRAIPDAMVLLDHTRKGGRYDIVAHPWIPDVLRKQTARGADQIWEARPKWTRPELPPGEHEVTALDINGAYLSALKTHLPIGQLEHSTGFGHDRRRAGVHLITPPEWEHSAVLPNPLGNRDEPGPLWVTEPTLRLLLRLSDPRHALCEPPVVHESFTSGATENLLEKFRTALQEARSRAVADDDDVTLEYVKAMYSKFVSTMGESNYNRQLYRPDWMHLIRSQAFANLWMKAYKAHEQGLGVVRAMGTDELHVTGDWRRVFPEGRGVSEVKVKDVYTVGDPVE